MIETLTKTEFHEIFAACQDFLSGNVYEDEESLEDWTEFEYGSMGKHIAMPFAFECVEKDMTFEDTAHIAFGKNKSTVNQDELVGNVSVILHEEDEEEVVESPPVQVVEMLAVEPTQECKPTQKSSNSLSGRSTVIYDRLYAENPSIKNVDAQKQIALELEITCTKQKNSIRALVVKFKKAKK